MNTDYEFTGDIAIPKEIKANKSAVILGLDVRELFLCGLGLSLGAGLMFLLFGVFDLHNYLLALIMPISAAPFFFFAFQKRGGMYMEDYLLMYYSNRIVSSPQRKHSSKNVYAAMREDLPGKTKMPKRIRKKVNVLQKKDNNILKIEVYQ